VLCRGGGEELGEGLAPESSEFARYWGEPNLGYNSCFRFDRVWGREWPGVLHVEELGF